MLVNDVYRDHMFQLGTSPLLFTDINVDNSSFLFTQSALPIS